MFVLSIGFSFAADMRQAKTKEQIETIYNSQMSKGNLNVKKKEILKFLKAFSQKYLNIDTKQMSYKEFKADFYSIMHPEFRKLGKLTMDNYFAQTILMVDKEKYGIYQEELIKDSEYHYKGSYVFQIVGKRHPEKLAKFVPISKIREIAVETGKSKRIEDVKYSIKLIKVCFNQMKDEEIKSDLKQIKRAVYPRIADSNEWKAVIVEMELMIKSVE